MVRTARSMGYCQNKYLLYSANDNKNQKGFILEEKENCWLGYNCKADRQKEAPNACSPKGRSAVRGWQPLSPWRFS